MFGFGQPGRPQFGGVGVMVRPPSVEVTISPAERFRISGELTKRAEHFAMTALRHWDIASPPACEIRVQSPADHIGLGVGTQLGMAVAAGLRQFMGLPALAFADLASSVGRGKRSFIGTIGFEFGKLIVEYGKKPGERDSSVFMLEALPDEWRFVLICPKEQQGLAGEMETAAFEQLSPVPESVTIELMRIANQEITCAAAFKDCDRFGEAVYSFGRLAGECFRAVQGGPFANANIGRLVETIRDQGIAGVGQSSWGPTVFAIVANDTEAQRLNEWLRSQADWKDHEVVIAQPDNCGATIESR
jgi:beta-RFAP synthase